MKDELKSKAMLTPLVNALVNGSCNQRVEGQGILPCC